MAASANADFQKLCEEEFHQASDAAYENLDREIIDVRARFASMGHILSTDLGHAVMHAVLQRFDKVVNAFDQVFLDKWRNDSKLTLTDEDKRWLDEQVTTQLEHKAAEAGFKCQGYLWDQTRCLARYWEQTGIEARQRLPKVRKSIEILQLQMKSQPTPAQATSTSAPETHPFGDLPVPSNPKAAALLDELQRCYQAACWNACGILIGVLIERALDAVEPDCREQRGLGKKLSYCLNQSSQFGASLKDALRELKAAKVTRDIAAHDSTIILGKSDIDTAVPYFRHLVKFWASHDQ
jgi:hypothetical protein